MGLDFIRLRAPTFRKSWDRGKMKLATPDLLTQQPECNTRSVVAVVDQGCELPKDTEVAVCTRDKQLIVLRENTIVARGAEPPPDIYKAIDKSGEMALGRIAKFNPLSGTVDVDFNQKGSAGPDAAS